jgi:hypothetical protein
MVLIGLKAHVNVYAMTQTRTACVDKAPCLHDSPSSHIQVRFQGHQKEQWR